MNASTPPLLARDQLEIARAFARRALRHWIAALLALVMGLGATVATAWFWPRKYASGTVLRFQEGVRWDERGESARQAVLRLRDAVLARSRLRDLVERQGLYPHLTKAGKLDEAVDELLRNVAFRVGEGDTFSIGFVADTPERSRDVTAALSSMVVEDFARGQSERVGVDKQFLDAQYRQAEELLRQRERELAQFLAAHPDFVSETTPGGPGSRAAEESRRAADAAAAAAAVSQPSRSTAEPGRPVPQGPDRSRYAELAAAEARTATALHTAQGEYTEASSRFTEKHPATLLAIERMKEAEAAHQAAAKALEEERRRLDAEQRRVDAAQTERTPEAAPRPAAAVSRPIPAFRRPANAAALETDYARLVRELADQRDRVQKLDSRNFSATLQATSVSSGRASAIVVLDPAYVPTAPTGVRRMALLVAGGALSVLLALGIAVIAAVLDDRIEDPRDLSRVGLVRLLVQVSGVSRLPRPGPPPKPEAPADPPVAQEPRDEKGDERRGGHRALLPVTTVREIKGGLALRDPTESALVRHGSLVDHDLDRSDPRLVLLHSPDSPAAAGFRVLRHRLVQGEERPRILLVTSASPNEGKTTCALNLALALSEHGCGRVLLLDGNFRAPALGMLLGLSAPPFPPWERVEHLTRWLDASVIGARSDGEVVHPPTVRARLEQLSNGPYDYIVIDGPPVLGSADVNVLEESVDGVLFALRARRSRALALRNAVEQIRSPKVLGAVLLSA